MGSSQTGLFPFNVAGNRRLRLVPVFFASILCASNPIGHQRPIWSLQTQGFNITWTTQSLEILPLGGGQAIYQSRDKGETQKERGVEVRKAGEAWDAYSLLSVVGPVVSIREESYLLQGDGTGSSGDAGFLSLDLSKGGKPADLRDYFPESAILSALLSDSLVAEGMKRRNARIPATLPELIKALTDDQDEEFHSFDPDLLKHFAFHHLEGDRVAVRLTGWIGYGAGHSTLVQLGILLPTPGSLKAALEGASRGTGGFLMKDQKKISGGHAARW